MCYPSCTLKSDESEPGLEPRCPLHSFSHKQRSRAELGSPTLKFVPRGAFAGQFCCILATCWYVALCISTLAVPVLSSGTKCGQAAGAAWCSGRSRGCMLGERDAQCVWHEDIHGFGRSGCPVPDCPCPHGL